MDKKRLIVKRMGVGAASIVRQGAEKNSDWLVVQEAAEEDDPITDICQAAIDSLDEAEQPFEKLAIIDKLAADLREQYAPEVTQSGSEVASKIADWAIWQGAAEYARETVQTVEQAHAWADELANLIKEEVGPVEQATPAPLVSREAKPLVQDPYPSRVNMEPAEMNTDLSSADAQRDDDSADQRAGEQGPNEAGIPAFGSATEPETCPMCGLTIAGADGGESIQQEGVCSCESPATVQDVIDLPDQASADYELPEIESVDPANPGVEQASVIRAPRGNKIEDVDGPVRQSTGDKWGSVLGGVFRDVQRQAVEQGVSVHPDYDENHTANTTSQADIAAIVAQAVAAAVAPLQAEIAGLQKPSKARSRQPDAAPAPVKQSTPESVWQSGPLARLFG